MRSYVYPHVITWKWNPREKWKKKKVKTKSDCDAEIHKKVIEMDTSTRLVNTVVQINY